MPDKIVQGRIEDMDTGEVYFGDHYLFCPGFEITTIVKILETNSYINPDDSLEVRVDCLGLDDVGSVFELDLYYTPESIEQRDKLMQDLTADSIFMVKGGYGIGGLGTTNSYVTIYNAAYLPVEPDFSEDEIREVFRVNGKEWEKITEPC